MRKKEPRLIFAFHTTADAMATESLCKEKGLPGRLVPVPREISAGCGIAWAAPPEAEEAIAEAMKAAGIVPQEAKVIGR